MNGECVREYRDRLEKGIAEYMKMPVGQKSAEAIKSMYEALAIMDEFVGDDKLTDDKATAWVAVMHNADGTTGGRFDVSETTSWGIPDDISDKCWNAVCNMMYSDYCDVAMKYGVNVGDFYADMARAFIEDADAVEDKVEQYYEHVVNLKV